MERRMKKRRPRTPDIAFRSGCPIATTLDLVGDRWSLVIVRDMIVGKAKFGEFLASPEQVPTNILTARLRRMEQVGLVVRQAYQNHPARYEYRLSDKGMALLPVLQDMCRWANTYVPGTWTPPESFMSRTVQQ
jgi:DNA-binding HxlR family transcriptional regulator